MKNLPFDKEDYKTIILFILIGLTIGFIGLFTFPKSIEEIGNFLKFAGIFPFIGLLIYFWKHIPRFVRCGGFVGLIGLTVSPVLHAYKVFFIDQPQNYIVNMSYHLTMITLYLVGLVWVYKWYNSQKKIR